MAPLHYAAKFDPFLSLDCARVEGVGAQSNFAIWQHCIPHVPEFPGEDEVLRPRRFAHLLEVDRALVHTADQYPLGCVPVNEISSLESPGNGNDEHIRTLENRTVDRKSRYK